MGFELRVVQNTPLTAQTEPRDVARTFLTQIGYLAPNSDGQIPFSLFYDCLLLNPEKPWTVEGLEKKLSTSRPTVYRHLNKLKGFDLLEETTAPDAATGAPRKAYRIRYGDLSKAWNFVEAHLRVAAENYSRTVDHLSDLVSDAPAKKPLDGTTLETIAPTLPPSVATSDGRQERLVDS